MNSLRVLGRIHLCSGMLGVRPDQIQHLLFSTLFFPHHQRPTLLSLRPYLPTLSCPSTTNQSHNKASISAIPAFFQLERVPLLKLLCHLLFFLFHFSLSYILKYNSV